MILVACLQFFCQSGSSDPPARFATKAVHSPVIAANNGFVVKMIG
jgi:hypothetical protein